MHGSVLGFFAYGALQGREVAGRDVLEVGSLDVNGSIRPMVEARQPRSYLGVDVVDGPGVDRHVDASDLVEEFGRSSFDVVVSTEMLEHAENWMAALAAMTDVLRPGGVLVLTTRSPGFAYHHPPDRWRFTQDALAQILRRLRLDPVVLMDDPEHPGVFVKARKPERWANREWYDFAGIVGVTAVREPLRWLALPANPDGCGYYRFWQPWTQLQRHSGHEVLLPPPGSYHDPGLDEDEVDAFDLVACQRPNGRRWLRDWHRWHGHTRLVYEADDHILDPDSSGTPGWLDDHIRETATSCLRLATLVTCSTEPLADVFRRYNDRVVVIPDMVHEDLLTLERPRRERPVVGWAGGASHLQDLCMIQEPLNWALHESGAELHLVGMDYRPLFYGQGRYTPWQVDVWDYYHAVDFDVALCPLADTAFNRARAPIKALEMAALGIPVVAADVEPYRGFVLDGVTGYLARSPEQWRARVRELVHDQAAREELGAKARELAAGLTIQQGWRRWVDAYEGVCSS